MLGGKVSYYLRIRAFKLENVYSPSCPLGKQDAVQFTSALGGGCVMHKALKVPVYSEWAFEILGHRS